MWFLGRHSNRVIRLSNRWIGVQFPALIISLCICKIGSKNNIYLLALLCEIKHLAECLELATTLNDHYQFASIFSLHFTVLSDGLSFIYTPLFWDGPQHGSFLLGGPGCSIAVLWLIWMLVTQYFETRGSNRNTLLQMRNPRYREMTCSRAQDY